jgi:mono/diheme cytochrome c family protein
MRKSIILGVLVALAGTPSLLADAAGDFAKNCAVCHGKDGKGKFALDFTNSDAAMQKAIEEGTASKDGKVKMKSFKDKVDTKAMINYIKSLKK